MDILFVRDLKIDLLIGIYDWERQIPQTVQLDIDIGLTDNRAAESGRIEDTIDYGQVIKYIRETLPHEQFSLVEALAERIASIVRNDFGAPWVRVSVAKLGMANGVKQLGIIIERGSST